MSFFKISSLIKMFIMYAVFAIFKVFSSAFLLENTNNSITGKHLIFKTKLPNLRVTFIKVKGLFIL